MFFLFHLEILYCYYYFCDYYFILITVFVCSIFDSRKMTKKKKSVSNFHVEKSSNQRKGNANAEIKSSASKIK